MAADAAPRLREREATPSRALVAALGSPLLARLLAARGIDAPAALDLALPRLLDPRTLGGSDAAASLIAGHLRAGARICIVGDYDADGATSTALAVSGLRALGAPDVTYLVPDRQRDGYGLSVPLAERTAATGARLLVTVDNGIGSSAGVARARELGLDVIVTDHHLPGATLPEANVIVNPNLPGDGFASKSLAGVGVMFYVLLALRARLRADGWFDVPGRATPNLAGWLDLVALGSVADVVPLDANNRVLVHQGLQRMRAGRARPGIQALLRVANRTAARLTERDLAFAIAPRLNAAGRLADMSVGVRCLLAESQAEADALALQLQAINSERRALSENMTAHALALLQERLVHAPRSICLHAEQWHEGIVGIVAGRVREVAERPAFAFATAKVSDDRDAVPLLKGSGRSVPGVNLRDVLVEIDRMHPGLLLRFGGHAMAAGVTLTPSRLAPFAAALEAVLAAQFANVVDEQGVDCDGSLALEDLSVETALQIERLGPWGSGFPPPRFADEFEVVHTRVLTPRFHRLVLRRGERMLQATCTGSAPAVGMRCGALYGLAVDRYRDSERLQLELERWWVV